MRLREIAATHVRYGYRRLTVLLRREGWKVNAKIAVETPLSFLARLPYATTLRPFASTTPTTIPAPMFEPTGP